MRAACGCAPLGLLYPFFTLLVIVGTANHYIIDAFGGAAVVVLGVRRPGLLSGHGAYTPPFDAPDFGMPDPPLPQLRARRPPEAPTRRSQHQSGGVATAP